MASRSQWRSFLPVCLCLYCVAQGNSRVVKMPKGPCGLCHLPKLLWGFIGLLSDSRSPRVKDKGRLLALLSCLVGEVLESEVKMPYLMGVVPGRF